MEKNNKNKKISATVWTTSNVDDWMRDREEGILHKENPWLDGVVGVKRAGLSFEYTHEELEELAKCARDPIYFANNYGYCLHGNQGYKPITLRDYQEEMLRGYFENRYSITLACRQIGKCSIDSKLDLQQNENNFHKYIEDIYYERKNHSVLSKIKQWLLKIYRKL